MKHAESQQQRALISWADHAPLPHVEGAKIGDYLFAVPNGGLRNKVTAAIMKAEGVRAGVPDLMLAFPWNDRPGLFIEMKSIDGKVSPAQRQWIEKLSRAGYVVEVCYSWPDARLIIMRYLGLTE